VRYVITIYDIEVASYCTTSFQSIDPPAYRSIVHYDYCDFPRSSLNQCRFVMCVSFVSQPY